MEEQTIKAAAVEAINALQLDCGVAEVSQSGERWCVRFTGDYSQFSDEFRDHAGAENSPELIREKVKRHLLACVEQLRRKVGRRGSRLKSTGGIYMANRRKSEGSQPLATTMKVFEEVIDTTSRALGNAVEQASQLTDAARETAASAVSIVSPTAGEVIKPEGGRGGSDTGGQESAQRMVEAGARQTRRVAAQANQSTSRAARQAARTANRAVGKTSTTIAQTIKTPDKPSSAPKRSSVSKKSSAASKKTSVSKKSSATGAKKSGKGSSASKRATTSKRPAAAKGSKASKSSKAARGTAKASANESRGRARKR
jgi:hypothetical protein